MFSLIRKKFSDRFFSADKKYSKVLMEDINLTIRTKYKNEIYTSYVEHFDKKEVIFRCPVDRYEIIRFRVGSEIEVAFVSESGLYKTKLLITQEIIEDDVVFYKSKINSSIEKNQRRKYYRLPINLEVNYTLIEKDHLEFYGETLDISAGGMLLETHEDISELDDLKVIIDIDEKKYNIESNIINKRINYRNGKFLYNLEFNGLNKRYRDEIARFISDSRKMKNMEV